MGVLTHRAEQAVLGAMLSDPGLAVMLEYLESGDFASNQHRLVRDAIMTASRSPNSPGSEWLDLVGTAGEPEISRQYLDELQAACPDPRHGTAYAAMVLEASMRRTLLGHAEDLASQAESLQYDARRLIHAVGSGSHPSERYALHMGWIATALRGHATQFDPDTTRAAAEPAFEGNAEAEDEELVLGALADDHQETAQVVSMLPASAFTDPLRQEIFEVIRSLRASSRPVDPLTIDWETARRQARRNGLPLDDGSTTDEQPSYVMQLAAAAVGTRASITGTVITLLEKLASSGNGQQPAPGIAAPRHAKPEATVRSDPGKAPLLIQPPPHLPEPGYGHAPQM